MTSKKHKDLYDDDGKTNKVNKNASKEHIDKVLNDKTSDFEKRKSMGVNARKKISSQFTLQRQADVFEEQYAKIIKQVKS